MARCWVPASGEAEVDIAQAEATIAEFERGGPRGWIERRPAQDGRPVWQHVLPATWTLYAREGQRATGAGHGHVEQPPRRVHILSSAGTVPPAGEDDDVIELQALGLVSGQQQPVLPAVRIPSPLGKPLPRSGPAASPPRRSRRGTCRSYRPATRSTVPRGWPSRHAVRAACPTKSVPSARSDASAACVSRSRQKLGRPRPPTVPECRCARSTRERARGSAIRVR